MGFSRGAPVFPTLSAAVSKMLEAMSFLISENKSHFVHLYTANFLSLLKDVRVVDMH